MKKKTYLVTGGTGFIGSAIVRRLVIDGHKVKVLDNNLRGATNRLKIVLKNIEFIRADIRDGRAVRKACRGADSVLHLAYLNGTEFFYKRPDLVLDIGVKGMINVVDSCILNGVEELILVSSSEVYQTPPTIPTDEKVPMSIPDPLNPRYSYAGGKIISELMAINYGRKYFKRAVIVRPHNVYGPDMGMEHVIPQFIIRMKDLCKSNRGRYVRFPIQGKGAETRAFIFIDDFVAAFMLVMQKGEHLGIYNIGTSEEVTMKALAMKTADYFAKDITIIQGKAPQGGTPRRCPDITKIKKLGFTQKIALADGFKITAGWYDEFTDGMLTETKRRAESEKIRPYKYGR